MKRFSTAFSFFLLIYIGICACASRHAAAVPFPSAASPYIRQLLPDSSGADIDSTATCQEADEGIDETQSLPERLQRLLDNEIFERTQVGLCVYDLTADTLLFAYHEQQCMRPASNEKIVTAITALQALGTDYAYRTRLYTVGEVSDSVLHGAVYVKGGYDPLLDDNDLKVFADSLKARGIRRVTDGVRMDLSMKDTLRLGWGWCWDDEAVPLTPLLLDNDDRFLSGWRRALREAGIKTDSDEATEGRVPQDASLVCERTHTIDQVLLPMMKESDNSMAESLFYQIAAAGGQPFAGRKQAVARVNALIRKVGLDPAHYQIADGSGLSLYNYLTPQLLMRLLRYAYKDGKIYRHLLPSLPIAGTDGTLKRRLRKTAAEGNVRAKTGTVEGVSTLSGYCTSAEGHTLCFSIMNQGLRYTSTGRKFQDRVCRALTI